MSNAGRGGKPKRLRRSVLLLLFGAAVVVLWGRARNGRARAPIPADTPPPALAADRTELSPAAPSGSTGQQAMTPGLDTDRRSRDDPARPPVPVTEPGEPVSQTKVHEEPREEPANQWPGSARPRPDGSAPGPEYTIKAKLSSRLFHPPTSPYYARTRADVWFRTAEEARAAGFTEYRRRTRQSSSKA